MHVAIEGCCHGELDAIYASLARAEREKAVKVDLLLICGDFQALRNEHDFESLAVPLKFRNLGSFHSYYSGEKVAPMLTIIIGGNHEASNYMWELYHGGWVAPNIYYLGTAGSVLVNGLRISGASGIYKPHDYYKGFFETLPYDRSTLRSCYHIRHHSVTKLMLLPPSPSPFAVPPATSPSPFPPSAHPAIFLSHDWPLSIAPHGDLPALLRRKPFFADEIRDDSLGSKPLRELLTVLQPKWWFAAHLHVKFAAVWKHGEAGSQLQGAGGGGGGQRRGGPHQLPPPPAQAAQPVKNPDEIDLDDDDEVPAPPAAPVANPDEISLDDDDDEVAAAPAAAAPLPPAAAAAAAAATDQAADKAEAVETLELAETSAAAAAAGPENPDEIMLDDGDDDIDEEPAGHSHHHHHHHQPEASSSTTAAAAAAAGLPPRPTPAQEVPVDASASAAGPGEEEGVTRFLALDKCMPNKDFLQILDLPFPLASPAGGPPSLTYDPHWLAITRALHPFVSLTAQPGRLPSMAELKARVVDEMQWVEANGLGYDDRGEGKVRVDEVQRFWKTAPSPGEPGGGPSNWYTNPQTVAFCDMLQIPNKINPFPAGFAPPPLPFPSRFSASAPVPEAGGAPADGPGEQEAVESEEVAEVKMAEEGVADGPAQEAGQDATGATAPPAEDEAVAAGAGS